jgi:hypothetical protein
MCLRQPRSRRELTFVFAGENWRDFSAGVVGGMAGILIGQPLDVARVRRSKTLCTVNCVRGRTAFGSQAEAGSFADANVWKPRALQWAV